MRLDEYVWSRNPRGMHCISVYQTPLNIQRYTSTGMGWAKLLAVDTAFVDDAQNLLANNITPLVRLYVGRYGAGPFTPQLRSLVDSFARAGVRWFEFYNEPNIDVEWPLDFNPSWEDFDNVIRPMMDNWLVFAEYVASIGCYPGFPAMAESTVPQYAAVMWMDAFLNYLHTAHADRFTTLLANGAYCCTHPLVANHFYQEVPGRGPLSMREPHQQRSQEPGWHWEYPYDPVSQADDPGRTIYGGTALTPYGDPNGLEAMGRMFNERTAEMFGAQAIPVVGTEGGLWPFRGQIYQHDDRYPPYDDESQAEATVAMYEWIARRSPPWYFGVCMWKEDEYWAPDGYVAPAIYALERYPTVYKEIPSIPTMGGTRTPQPTITPRGPAPIRGAADFHMVILTDGLDESWFFDTARAYYERFRPIVSGRMDTIDLINYTRSLAVTVIATPERIESLRQYFAESYPNLWFDPIPATTREAVAAVFNARAENGLRFG